MLIFVLIYFQRAASRWKYIKMNILTMHRPLNVKIYADVCETVLSWAMQPTVILHGSKFKVL